MNSTVVGLLIIVFIASIAGWFFSRSKEAEKPVKVMLFVLYFWGSVFIQVMIFSVLYQYGFLDTIIK